MPFLRGILICVLLNGRKALWLLMKLPTKLFHKLAIIILGEIGKSPRVDSLQALFDDTSLTCSMNLYKVILESFFLPLANYLVPLWSIIACLEHVILLSLRLSSYRIMLSVIGSTCLRREHWAMVVCYWAWGFKVYLFLAVRLLKVISVHLWTRSLGNIIQAHVNRVLRVECWSYTHDWVWLLNILTLLPWDIWLRSTALKRLMVPAVRSVNYILVLIMHYIWERILLVSILRLELLLLLHLFLK